MKETLKGSGRGREGENRNFVRTRAKCKYDETPIRTKKGNFSVYKGGSSRWSSGTSKERRERGIKAREKSDKRREKEASDTQDDTDTKIHRNKGFEGRRVSGGWRWQIRR